MKLSELIEALNGISPFELQEAWDNSGLICGDPNADISKVVLSLEVTSDVIKNAPEGSALIVHHPLIFSALKSLRFDKVVPKLLRDAIKKDISIVALHTNFDKSHLNGYLAEKVFGFDNIRQDGLICYVELDTDFETLLQLVSSRLEIANLNCVATSKPIKTVALVAGSGGSLSKYVKADCFLTGDIKYHEAMEAYESDMGLIDITHYGSERFFGVALAPHLQFLGCEVIISDSKDPFVRI